jgi:hypothetical protein
VSYGRRPGAGASAWRPGIGPVLPIRRALCSTSPLGLLDLPADPWSERAWFFNPFSWQLIFFAGFAFGRGWLVAPPLDRRLISIAIAVLLLTVPFAWHQALELVPTLGRANAALAPLIDKTHLGALRVVHFLALAYLAYAVAGERGRCLRGDWVEVVQLVGRQSLAVFLTSLVLAQLLGVFLDLAGREFPTVAVANLTGFALLAAVARIVEWYKDEPWRKTTADATAERAPQLAGRPRSAARSPA